MKQAMAGDDEALQTLARELEKADMWSREFMRRYEKRKQRR